MTMVARATPIVTEHGILVPLGRFVRQIGIDHALGRVPMGMKTVIHSPGEKLAELLCHICGGGMHVTELEYHAHPLREDQAVAEAWGQTSFASASGVNALLRQAPAEAVLVLRRELQMLLAPYRRRVLRHLASVGIVVDLDLTGLVVSDQATTYEGADYGYMGETGKLGKGDQFARAQVTTEQESLVLGGFLHPGHTVSSQTVDELIGLIEATLGRPRRRVEVLAARLEAAGEQVRTLEAQVARWHAEGRPRQSQAEDEARLARLRDQNVDRTERYPLALWLATSGMYIRNVVSRPVMTA